MHIRTVLIVFALSATYEADAQGASRYRYFARLEPGPDEHMEKLITEGLVAFDPTARCAFDRSLGEAEILVSVAMQQEQFAYLLEINNGPALAEWSNALIGDGTVRRTLDEPGFPVYIDTGEPAVDDERYDAAKKDWMSAHPADYERLTQPQQ